MENSYIGMPNPFQQQYSDTCAIKSQQIILNQFGVNVSEDALVNQASQEGIYDHGTAMEDVGKLLNDYGVQTHSVMGGDANQLVSELAQGHRVIVGVDSSELWHDNQFVADFKDFVSGENPDHALIVAGIDTSDPNDIKVQVIDPGTGDCYKSYPLNQFMDAWQDSKCYMVATDTAPGVSSCPQMANFDYELGHIPMIGDMSWNDFQQNFPTDDITHPTDVGTVGLGGSEDNQLAQTVIEDPLPQSEPESEHGVIYDLTHNIGDLIH